MDYEQLNQQINDVKRELRDIRNEIRNTERSIDEALTTIDKIRANTQERINAKREAALNQKISEATKPFEIEVNKLREKKIKLKEVLDRNVQKYTFDECAKKYTDEYNIINQAKDSLADVEDIGADFLGENFSKQLYAGMNSVHIQPEDLNKIVVDLKHYKKNLKSMQKKSKNPAIRNYLDLLMSKTNPYKGNDEAIDTGALALYACCCVVLLFAVVLFGSWVYLIFLLVLAIVNLSRNYFIYKMLYYTKILSDNTEEISASLASKVEKDRENILKDLNQAYEERATLLETQIGEQQVKMRTVTENCREKFVFNDSDVLKEVEDSIRNKEADRRKQQATLSSYKIKEKKLEAQLNQLLDNLSQVSAGLVDSFLSCDRTGNEYILKTKYLIDEVDGKPVFWDFPLTSCLFVHNCEYSDISNFIKLMCIQILNTMNPFAFEINYWDLKELGMDMMVFDPLASANLFNIQTEESGIKEAISDMMFVLRKRSVNIMREYPNISQYNDAMLTLDSVTESYNFIFIPNYSKSVYNSNDLRSLIYKGADVGIYPMVFTTLDELAEMKNEYEEFLNQFGTIYSFSEDEIKARPAEFFKRRVRALISS